MWPFKKQEIPVLRNILLSLSVFAWATGKQLWKLPVLGTSSLWGQVCNAAAGYRIIYAQQPEMATDLMFLLTALILWNWDGANLWPGERGVCLIKWVDPTLKNFSSLGNWWFLVDDFSGCFWSVMWLYLEATRCQENKHSKNNWTRFFAKPKAKAKTHLMFLWL